ncbi:C40 family peptidase [Arcanobacterium phocisimile]|uniref:C40 family peptidase n=1 Tax=Arcanobacterium phocisimile TaxID=1302235 RepID=A0ABX7IH07_9ACTO|nr:NlpC/P60 family protein [Arcanobacterium phocisimile]QRV02251.1 C40 family peptidase [Arcanobacterium phocisimile]
MKAGRLRTFCATTTALFVSLTGALTTVSYAHAESIDEASSVLVDDINVLDLASGGSWVASGQRWWWRNDDGTWPAASFVRIDGRVYYFDDDGYMHTGWKMYHNQWVYFGSSGDQLFGWIHLGNLWYYLDPQTGIMTTGEKIFSDGKYYFRPSGEMVTGWLQKDQQWYYYTESGRQKTGWIHLGNLWYYLDPQTGIMTTGEKIFSDGKYYFHPSGEMVTGWLQKDQQWYYYTESGRQKTGWLKDHDDWYYLDPQTGIMVTGSANINGQQYSFNSSGRWRGYQAPAGMLQPVSSITPLGWASNELSPGMNGVKVAIVQKRLGLWHSMKLASVDSNFMAAVRNFQARVGLPATGIVNKATWDALATGYDWYVDQYQAQPVPLTARRSERIEAMIAYAQQQIGSPYTWGGAGPYNLGFDCSGLALQAIYAGGLDPQPINVHKHSWPDYRSSQELYRHPQMVHVPISQRQRGDLIFYTTRGTITHVAIYIGNDQVIHTDWMGHPARVDNYLTSYGWANTVKDVVRPFA